MWLVAQFSHNHAAAGQKVQQFTAVLTAHTVLRATCGGSTTRSFYLEHVFWIHQHGSQPAMHLALM